MEVEWEIGGKKRKSKDSLADVRDPIFIAVSWSKADRNYAAAAAVSGVEFVEASQWAGSTTLVIPNGILMAPPTKSSLERALHAQRGQLA